MLTRLPLLLIALWLAGCSGSDNPPKPWTKAMCSVAQDVLVSKEYIDFCIKNSPNVFPECLVSGLSFPRRPGYFEVLDCSWHPGTNPRETPGDEPVAKKQPRYVPAVEGEACSQTVGYSLGGSSDGTSFIYSEDTVYTFPSNQHFSCEGGKLVRDRDSEKKAKRAAEMRQARIRRFMTGAPLTAEELQETSFWDITPDFTPYRKEEKEAEFQRYLSKQLVAQIIALQHAVKDNDTEAARVASRALEQLGKMDQVKKEDR